MADDVVGNIGRCIYCGSTEDLTDEHIIPFGLQGQWVLENASCKACAKITSAFEHDILRNAWLSARAAIGIKTRHKKKRPGKFPLVLEKADGSTEERLVIPQEHLSALPFLVFPLPTSLGGPNTTKGINWNWDMHAITFGAQYDALRRDHPDALRIGSKVDFEPVNFAKMIGKIGYGMAVASFGLERVCNSQVISAILGKTDDIGRWVGGSATPRNYDPNEPGLHKVTVEEKNGSTELRVYVTLFAQFGGPEYIVCVNLSDSQSE